MSLRVHLALVVVQVLFGLWPVFGTVGLAQVAVPFETVRRLDVGSAVDEDHVIVHVTTRDGAAVDVVVDEDRPWYGRAAFGNFRIEIGQVRAIAIGE